MNDRDRAYKANQLRYRKAALQLIQRDTLHSELYAMASECSELEWSVEDDETLVDVFDGDTDEIREFRLAFSDLSAKCEQLLSAISDWGVSEHFDDFFVGALGDPYEMVGYDWYEEDYSNLTRYEAHLAQTVSGNRLMRLNKETLISTAGQCIGIMMSFLDIRNQYDCLKTVFDLLRDDRAELLKSVRSIEGAYNDLVNSGYTYDAIRKYENLVSQLPDRVWIE